MGFKQFDSSVRSGRGPEQVFFCHFHARLAVDSGPTWEGTLILFKRLLQDPPENLTAPHKVASLIEGRQYRLSKYSSPYHRDPIEEFELDNLP